MTFCSTLLVLLLLSKGTVFFLLGETQHQRAQTCLLLFRASTSLGVGLGLLLGIGRTFERSPNGEYDEHIFRHEDSDTDGQYEAAMPTPTLPLLFPPPPSPPVHPTRCWLTFPLRCQHIQTCSPSSSSYLTFTYHSCESIRAPVPLDMCQ